MLSNFAFVDDQNKIQQRVALEGGPSNSLGCGSGFDQGLSSSLVLEELLPNLARRGRRWVGCGSGVASWELGEHLGQPGTPAVEDEEGGDADSCDVVYLDVVGAVAWQGFCLARQAHAQGCLAQRTESRGRSRGTGRGQGQDG